MKRGKVGKKKEITKIRLKKTKNLITNKRIKEKEPDFFGEVYSGLKLLSKKYKNFREKQKIKKQKEEQIRLQEQEGQRLQEQEQQKLQEQIYKERVAKGDRERLKQLEKVRQLRQEEKQLKEFLIGEKKLKKSRSEEESRKLKEQEQQKLQEQEERRLLEEEQRPKEEGKRLNGKVKWFNDAKGYGFIKREGGEKDIFVHFSDVKKSDLKFLKEGEQLTFEIENSDKGPSAINLQKVTDLQIVPVLRLVKKN